MDREQRNAYQRAYYAANYERVRERNRKAERRRYANDPARFVAKVRSQQAKRYQIIADYKAGKPCQDCGVVYDACVMDLDHREGTAKVNDVSKLVTGASVARLLAELEKCDLVCANCHRMRSCKTHHVTHQSLP